MNKQMIYNFYVADNECNNPIYGLHYYYIKKYSSIFDKIIFIITYNGNMNDDIIYRIKAKLISICKCNHIQFIYEYNIPRYREGIIFKKYIIDKLDDYNDYLTFFAHTKGVTNKVGIDNPDNLYKWICAMYELNFSWLDEVYSKLNANAVKYDYISYGALYFKDYRHNNINNWFYSGSFQWLNTYKLSKHIKENNIDIKPFICDGDERLKRCAELFIGSCIDSSHVAFHNDERFNKENESFHMYGWEISYKYIDLLIKQYLNIWEYTELNNMYESLKIDLNINEQY